MASSLDHLRLVPSASYSESCYGTSPDGPGTPATYPVPKQAEVSNAHRAVSVHVGADTTVYGGDVVLSEDAEVCDVAGQALVEVAVASVAVIVAIRVFLAAVRHHHTVVEAVREAVSI